MIILKILGSIVALIILYVLFLVVCSLFVNPNREYEKHSRFYRFLLDSATSIAMCIMRIRIHTTGIDKLPRDTKKILFVSNHRSNYDPIITWYVLRKWKPAFVSKASNFKIPIFGRIIRKCCFLAIDRENPQNAMKTINKAAQLLGKGEVSVGIYPEGTRSKSGELLPFHNGVFRIAQKANAPIAVLSVTGTERIFRNYPFHHTDVNVYVLEVIPAETAALLKTEDIGEYVHALINCHQSPKEELLCP